MDTPDHEFEYTISSIDELEYTAVATFDYARGNQVEQTDIDLTQRLMSAGADYYRDRSKAELDVKLNIDETRFCVSALTWVLSPEGHKTRDGMAPVEPYEETLEKMTNAVNK